MIDYFTPVLAYALGLASGYYIHRYIPPALEQRRIRRELAKWRARGRP